MKELETKTPLLVELSIPDFYHLLGTLDIFHYLCVRNFYDGASEIEMRMFERQQESSSENAGLRIVLAPLERRDENQWRTERSQL